MVVSQMQAGTPESNSTDFMKLHSVLQKTHTLSTHLDYPFTFDEIADYFLPAQNLTGPQLKSLIAAGKFADIPFQIQDGYLLTKPSQSQNSRAERERFSAAKLKSVSRFAKVLSRLAPFVQTVAVTGSVAYGSAGKWDDIDLFLITQKKRLWISLLMTLITIRAYKLMELAPSHLLLFCLSYVHDQDGFTKDATRNQTNPLFARELLMAKPVLGEGEYRRILENNAWVGKLYARPYASTLSRLDGKLLPAQRKEWFPASLVLDWAESVVYVLLSRYLKLRAYLTNLKLKSKRNELRVFEPMITPNSCIYTSNFYKWLHQLWGKI